MEKMNKTLIQIALIGATIACLSLEQSSYALFFGMVFAISLLDG
jgi:hypothetical protein